MSWNDPCGNCEGGRSSCTCPQGYSSTKTMKTILLYSGGLDSVLANYLWKPDMLLYIHINSGYSDLELEQLDNPFFRFGRDTVLHVDNLTFDFSDCEKDNYIVPFRNLYLILRALNFGQRVILGYNKDDISGDKDEDFLSNTQKLVDKMVGGDHENYAPDSWSGPLSLLQAPSSKYDKTELVQKALTRGIDPNILLNVRTCYDNFSKQGCGRCVPCIQKEIALYLNDIPNSYKYFDDNPTDAALVYYKEWAEEHDKQTNRVARLRQYLGRKKLL